MAARKAHRDVEAEAPENHERWLLTYADLITLLVAFFIMMYSMSVINLTKFQQLAIAIRSGSMGNLNGNSGSFVMTKGETMMGPVPSPKPSLFRAPGKDEGAMSPKENGFLPITYESPHRGVDQVEKLHWQVLTDEVLFPPGSAELNSEGCRKLQDLRDDLTFSSGMVLVEGYTATDTNSAATGPWQLSSARAAAVIQYLADEIKVERTRFMLRAYGTWRYNPERPLTKVQVDSVVAPTTGSNDLVVVMLQMQETRTIH